MMQPRFERRHGQAPLRLLEHLRLRAGYDFLLLRCDCGEAQAELGRWWTDFMQADDAQRQAMAAQRPEAGSNPPPARRRRRGGRRKAGDAVPADAGDGDHSA
jgi:poly(A) polymerase